MNANVLCLTDYSEIALGECMFPTQSTAEAYFKDSNISGNVILCKIKDINGGCHLIWVAINKNKPVGVLPAFFENIEWPMFNYDTIQRVTGHEFFLRNRVSYILNTTDDGKIDIYTVKIFANQDLISALLVAQGKIVKDAYLVKIRTILGNKYITTCWCVLCADASDPDNEEEEICSLVPVDLRDSRILQEYDVNDVNTEMVMENEGFFAGSVHYILKRDEADKLYISKSPMQIAHIRIG